MRVVNAATVAEQKMKNGEVRVAKVYAGTAEENKTATNSRVFEGGEAKYKHRFRQSEELRRIPSCGDITPASRRS